VCQQKGPVELVVWKFSRLEIGSRRRPHIDAVNFDAFDRPTVPTGLATANENREKRRAAIHALCCGIKIVGDAVGSTEPCHDGQAANQRELRGGNLRDQCPQGANEARR
jgi:hypothetical protein